MAVKMTFLVILSIFSHVVSTVNCEKVITTEALENYSSFFNFGERKLTKLEQMDLENSILKSKVDVLGEIFKKHIDELKAWEKLDMIFLIDASSSVGEANFKSEIKFVKKLLSDVAVDYNHTRIAIITFSSKDQIVKDVDEITQPKEENNKCLLFNKEVNEIKYTGGGTHTLGAFQIAKNVFAKSRNDSKKVLFLITDGFSNGGDPIPLANELKKGKVIVFTIGIRNGNYKELYELSSNPGEFYSYLLDSFEEFESLARRALHVDIKTGDYVPLGTNTPCDKLCPNGNCCDKNAICSCGTSTGHYTCLCQPGYYGSGLQNSCSPCPSGTFADGPNLCLPCPDIHHVTSPPANSIESCKCKSGYRATKDHQCEVIKCPKLTAPEHGYFVRRKECGNVLHNACGVRCEVGYALTGNSIRLCQENGTWSGYAPTCTVKTCEKLTAPLHGNISCSHSDLGIAYDSFETKLPVDTVCSFVCEKDRILIGSAHRTCLPLAQWDGLRSSCKPIKCNKLSSIPNGRIEPKSCVLYKQPFGTVCKYVCEKGYDLSGPEVKSCTGKHGTWSDRFNQTNCQDVTPPDLVCPKDVKNTTASGKKFGHAFWTAPTVSDNSGLNVSLWMKPAVKNPANFKFNIGKTIVTYYAQDAYKNLAKCSFIVEIEDREPPTIENCLDPPIFLTANRTANITWDEPTISDNSENVFITKSEDFGIFDLGTTPVLYSARDSSNNTIQCLLNITVQESHCEPLPDPVFGQSKCTSLANGIKCVITCQEGYAIPIGTADSLSIDNSGTNFLCNHSDPIWYSLENSIFPDCTVSQIPKTVNQKGVISVQQESVDICNDSRRLEELENDIKNDLKTNLDDTCIANSSCKVNTSAICENDTQSEYEERTNKIKRDTANNPKSHQKRRINVVFEVNATVSNKIKDVDLRKFNNVQNYKFSARKNKMKILHIKATTNVICPPGFVQRKFKCVQCPKGTFLNDTSRVCESCPLGTFNDDFGQTLCKPCPMNSSTSKLRAKSISDCKPHCPPGTHARKKFLKHSKHHPNAIQHQTLSPHCKSCAIGAYQTRHGQTLCKSCPPGYTTTRRKSASITQCIPTAKQICSNFTDICNQGTCMPESEFHYSCSCKEDYIGSNCEIRIDSCFSNPCLNAGTCLPQHKNTQSWYACKCRRGFAGSNCEEILDRCEPECLNNGTCIKSEDEQGICICADGYAGDFCQIKIQYCHANLCENNGKCVEDVSGYRCQCVGGYIGKRCNILPCDYQPCVGNYHCVNVNASNPSRNSYRCDCPDGYEGPDCSQKINYCHSSPCLNDAECLNSDTNFTCICRKTFYGTLCENKMNADYILYFPRSSTTDLVKIDGFSENLAQISVCLWMKTMDDINYGTILSYATYDFDNAFTITDYTGLVFYINGQYAVTDIFLNDGQWHFFCIVWHSDNGTYSVYLEGKNVLNGSGLSAGSSIKGGGKLVIGQEQDILGGRFSQSESFLGKIAHLDLWKRELTDAEIFKLFSDCDRVFGDLYAWPEIQQFVQGDVKIEESTFCKSCKAPELLDQGSVDVINNTAFYRCNKGFELNVPKFENGRKCTKAAIWEGNERIRCQKVYCSYPGYVMNGAIIGRNFHYMDQIDYECLPGYVLNGPKVRVCQADGTWSMEQPSCISEIHCDKSSLPVSAAINVISELLEEDPQDRSYFDVGMQVEIVCPNNTHLEGDGILTCMENGTWDFVTPKCTSASQNSCEMEQIPPSPTNGYVTEESKNAVGNGTGNTIFYKCRPGYKSHGVNSSTCIIDGYWTVPNITCEPVKCANPPSFPKMKIRDEDLLNATVSYHYGNMVTFECVEGYKMIGSHAIRCLATGKWIKMQGRCNRISCYKPKVQETTIIEGSSYLYESEVSLICGQSRYVIRCMANGIWEGIGSNC